MVALPKAALDPKQYVDWRQDFADWIVQSQPLKLFSAPALKLMSEPDESERDFRIRTQQATRELRDGAVETLRARYAPKVARLDAKRRKAQEQVEREQQQVASRNCRRRCHSAPRWWAHSWGVERSLFRRSGARRLPHAASVGR